jgi:hypothetical protein
MENVKSAREIAMEKVNGLGGLSETEKEEKFMERCRGIASALAEKYVKGVETDLARELKKYGEPERKRIAAEISRKLLDSIELSDSSSTELLLKGVYSLNKDNQVLALADKMSSLVHRYEGDLNSKRREIAASPDGLLELLGVSGSAVAGVNVNAMAEFIQIREFLEASYLKEMGALKIDFYARFIA